MKTCRKCDAEFETGPELGAHAREAHSTVAKLEHPFTCADCSKDFELPSSWNPRLPEDRSRLCDACWMASWLDEPPLPKLESPYPSCRCEGLRSDGPDPWTCDCGRTWVLDPIWIVVR